MFPTGLPVGGQWCVAHKAMTRVTAEPSRVEICAAVAAMRQDSLEIPKLGLHDSLIRFNSIAQAPYILTAMTNNAVTANSLGSAVVPDPTYKSQGS